ncbi:hypothetical protein MOMA_05846 [Moraxella macacae 0408225]|uniref:Uncharacterized protein n=1 Tax=Moraxella macacae 0408225 TaxID=1230338 RepID=L2F4W4_9GAMM|nr:hypothetical protein [Moraxella macacae]ELA08059.1 hypothetical protein MOMA_05846 [Moraxella macacae 0408225]
MKNKPYLTVLFCTILFSQSAFAIYIPDLFGAYQRGMEQAQRDNARDAYYYQQLNQPKIFFEVINRKSDKTKNNFNLSVKNGDMLCWSVYNLAYDGVYQSLEIINMPYQGEFTGQSLNNDQQAIINKMYLNKNTIAFTKKLISEDNQIYTCWGFHPKNTPKGKYIISIVVGNRDFGAKMFNIVD